MTHSELLIGIAAIFVLGVGAQWIAAKLNTPSILPLLILGFIAGPVTELVQPDEMFGDLLFVIVPLAVGVVLFEGGMTLSISEIRSHHGVVRRLITTGLLVTWGIATGAAIVILDLSSGMAVLFGAVIVVSGPTVVGPLLRAVRPRPRVRTVLNWEGILIDPIGATLAVIVFGILIAGGGSLTGGLTGVLSTLVAGTIVGLIGAVAMVLLLKGYLIPDRMQASVTLVAIVTAFVVSDFIRPESGLLAVTLMGIVLANQPFVPVDRIVAFKETLRDLLIAALFIVLAARLEMEDVLSVGFPEVLFLTVIVLLARPLTVFISTLGSDLTLRERLFVAWVAPRGIVAAAVASVFAIPLEAQGIADADRLVPLTFLVIVGTVALYSLSAKVVGRLLGVVDDRPGGLTIVGANPVAREIARAVANTGVEVQLIATNHSELTKARIEGLDAVRASVLDQVSEETSGILLIATPNDEFNTLAAIRAVESRDRAHVYQLAPSGGSDAVAARPRARLFVSPQLTFITASEAMLSGGTFRSTSLTEQFTFEDYRERYGARATPAFLVERSRLVGVFSADSSLTPSPGQTLVSLTIPEVPKPAMVDEEEVIEAMERTRPGGAGPTGSGP
ncbi:MAG: sodium:proton antiporter [Gemmatimonadota bacterium]